MRVSIVFSLIRGLVLFQSYMRVCIISVEGGWVGIISVLYESWLVVVRIFNATRHPRHIEAAAIVMYMYLYSIAFMDHPCTLGAADCHQAPPRVLFTNNCCRLRQTDE